MILLNFIGLWFCQGSSHGLKTKLVLLWTLNLIVINYLGRPKFIHIPCTDTGWRAKDFLHLQRNIHQRGTSHHTWLPLLLCPGTSNRLLPVVRIIWAVVDLNRYSHQTFRTYSISERHKYSTCPIWTDPPGLIITSVHLSLCFLRWTFLNYRGYYKNWNWSWWS